MFCSLQVLIVTTDEELMRLTVSVLDREGHLAHFVPDIQGALALMAKGTVFHGVVIDTSRLPPSSRHLLPEIVQKCSTDALWMLSPLGVNPWLDDCQRLGICQFLKKPLQRHDVDGVVAGLTGDGQTFPIATATQARKRVESDAILEDLAGGKYFFACSAVMKRLYQTVRLLAPVDVPVLILGESGVGKDIVANLLHKHSLRSQESYVSINCAALPSDLLESELFGYEAGAFTGATKAKPGRFDVAHKGTLLLDEIGEMSPQMQAKLLHVLQDGHFCRLGARHTTQVDVRVVAATNIDMSTSIENGSFREDLFYRVSAFTIEIPPLRERREEIPFLAEQMIRTQAVSLRVKPVTIPPGLMAAMQAFPWPGNLRELFNFVTRILVTQDPNSAFEYLSRKLSPKPQRGKSIALETEDGLGGSMTTLVRGLKGQTESRLIKEALERNGWNRRHAAMQLGISYRSLLYKIQDYQLVDTRSNLHFNVH